MKLCSFQFRVGLRTIKTAVAVIVSMIIVDMYGATTSKLIFAVLGAMAAVQPTFRDSLDSCITQTIGVLFGAVMGVLLLALPIHSLVAAGAGIILVISLYNTLHIRFSPSLSCIIVVTLCTTPGVQPMSYAFSRIWDTAIGMGIGMLINTLIFPYDNSRRIRDTVESLNREVIQFLEEMFDGDNIMPDARQMQKKIAEMEQQLHIFSNQWLLHRINNQKKELASFRICEAKARELVARMEVLSLMEQPGRLNSENRKKLTACGANILDTRPLDAVQERDVVTNYHVKQILKLRRELLEALGE